MPGKPGVDAYVAAAGAYARTRDINLEVLSRGAGLRITI